jgi:hypothetical protein
VKDTLCFVIGITFYFDQLNRKFRYNPCFDVRYLKIARPGYAERAPGWSEDQTVSCPARD